MSALVNEFDHGELLPFALGAVAGNWIVQTIIGGAVHFAAMSFAALGAFAVIGGMHCVIRRRGF